MRHIIAAAVLGTVSLLPFVTQEAHAASEDECAIWICAPGGFAPSECGPARSAMISRVKDLKPPLPPLSACMVDPPAGAGGGGSSSTLSGQDGIAAYIPERRVCDRWTWVSNERQECSSWRTEPERYVKGVRCRTTNNDAAEQVPSGCTRTARYVEVYIDGELAGPTYYF
ncbi:conjugal transfer protein TraL [Halomonas casei]|uniref:conjugal transfer protein TraL n=1 Tax=Halomonas casei TaxID=2742613 RepID=UPI003CECE744